MTVRRSSRPLRAAAAFGLRLALLTALACSRRDAEPTAGDTASASATSSAPRGVRLEKAPEGEDVAAVVRAFRAQNPARAVVVYVGASWCEPCQRFHEAAARGELDASFPELTLLEFDLDVDRERLIRGGYASDMIPLFVLPTDDGRGSDKRFEGSIKGPNAVANIAPRLRALLAK